VYFRGSVLKESECDELRLSVAACHDLAHHVWCDITTKYSGKSINYQNVLLLSETGIFVSIQPK
jgi:hypothetical protein